uniref:Uncharacterized protein n=1 Tax=Setaria digitata TaxID=48799 RepID=A0A915PQR9_9BILA
MVPLPEATPTRTEWDGWVLYTTGMCCEANEQEMIPLCCSSEEGFRLTHPTADSRIETRGRK